MSDNVKKFIKSRAKKEFIKEHAKSSKKKKNAKKFAKTFKKSYDYRDHGVMIDAKDQQAAEETTNPNLIKYLSENFNWLKKGEVNKLDTGNGVLTLTKKDEGLFNGFWQTSDGQIEEKFDDQTIAMVAKNLMIKGWVGEEVIPTYDEVTMAEPDESTKSPSYLRIKMGDFEMELRKSIKDFVKSWNSPDKGDIKKALNIWKSHRMKPLSRKDALKEILDNWDQHSEDFNQILHAVRQSEGE